MTKGSEVVWREVVDGDVAYTEAMHAVSGVTLHLAVSKTGPNRWTWVIYNEEAAYKKGSPFASHGSSHRRKEAQASAVFWAEKIFS